MANAADEIIHVSFPISKFEKDADGDLVVYGKATDGSLDSDDQVVDPEWSAKALADFHTSGGNIRVQHQARRDPAGKSLSIEIDRDGDSGHWLKSLVVEPVAKRLVEKGVLAAYSVGIARPVIKRDPTGKARGGIVCGGELAEISLVDRPANKNCGLMLAKSEGGTIELTEELVFEDGAKFENDELLTKDAGGGSAGDPASQQAGSASAAAPSSDPSASDDDEDDEDEGDVTDSSDNDGVSKGGAEPDLIATADGATRVAYKSARTEWLGREPSVKDAVSGTEYLAKRSEWMKWNTEGEDTGLTGTRDGAERWLSKRDFSQAERDSAADSGAAMPGGSFPIKNGEDLSNAIHLAGHAKDPSAARAHIKRRAAALGLSDKIPDSWKTSEPDLAADDLADLITKTNMAISTVNAMLGYEAAEKKASPDGTVGDTSAEGGKQCPTCKGDGKIMGNQRQCPDCNGTGKFTAKTTEDPEAVKGAKSCTGCGKSYDADTNIKNCENCGQKLPKADKAAKKAARAARKAAADPQVGVALGALQDTVSKALAAGLITQADADTLMAEAADKATRPLPADTKPAGTHREPDGTSTVEQLEPEAGLGTDPDPVPDKVPASTEVSSMKSDAPYSVARMHDALCAAYDMTGVTTHYPAVKTVADAVDETWFTAQVAAAAAAGKTKKVTRLVPLLEAAQSVKGMDQAAVEDGRAHLHKAFSDLYPNEHISPSEPPRPGSYQRPYLSAGHASEHASGSAHIPSSVNTPSAEDYHRPLITDGHQSDSPANKDGSRPPAVTGGARTFYTTAARDTARAALEAMHDHIAGAFPDICPMAASKSVMPPDMGASNVPHPAHPQAPSGGIDVGKGLLAVNEARKAFGLDPWVPPAVQEAVTQAAPALTEKAVTKAVRKALTTYDIAAPSQGLTADQLRSLLTEQLEPITSRYETEITALRKELDDLGSKPDPVMAPVRGVVAKAASDAPAVPVERRSLVDEATQVRDHAAAEEASYRAYVEARARSTDPGTREKALTVLDQMNKAAGLPAA